MVDLRSVFQLEWAQGPQRLEKDLQYSDNNYEELLRRFLIIIIYIHAHVTPTNIMNHKRTTNLHFLNMIIQLA